MTPELPQALAVAIRVIEALQALRIEYHIGGSLASSIHGIPRQTQDIDFVVDMDAERASLFAEGLHGEFYADPASAREAAAEKGSFNLVHLASGIKVDVFVRGNSAFDMQ